MKRNLFIGLLAICCIFGGFLQAESEYKDFIDVEIYGESLLLIEEQLIIGNSDSLGTDLGTSILLIKEMEEYTGYDPMGVLDKAVSMEKAFDNYLELIDDLLIKASDNLYFLEYKMRIFKNQELNCWASKESYEKQFFEGFESYDPILASESIDQTIKYEACASDGRINYNSYNTVYKKMKFYHDTLSRKYEYRVSNKTTIVENAEYYY